MSSYLKSAYHLSFRLRVMCYMLCVRVHLVAFSVKQYRLQRVQVHIQRATEDLHERIVVDIKLGKSILEAFVGRLW